MTSLGPQFTQLQLLATPHEVGQMRSADFDHRPMTEVPGLLHDMYAHQQKQHGYSGATRQDRVEDSVAAKGVQKPLKLMHLATGGSPVVYDGHHRYSAAAKHDMLMPVQHYTDYAEAMRDIVQENEGL